MAQRFTRTGVETSELIPTEDVLPDPGSDNPVFGQLGFAWGKKHLQDPLFREVRLPLYWSLKATEDPTRWDVVDRWGTPRAEVLYRNAPGGRIARISPVKRFYVRVDERGDGKSGIALDRGMAVYRSKSFKHPHKGVELAEAWLDEHYEGWRSFISEVNSIPN